MSGSIAATRDMISGPWYWTYRSEGKRALGAAKDSPLRICKSKGPRLAEDGRTQYLTLERNKTKGDDDKKPLKRSS